MVVLCVTLILQATLSALGIMPYWGLNHFGQPVGRRARTRRGKAVLRRG